jgi:hypothetical protein
VDDVYMREDGRIGVLYSPGYGAGWSSWARVSGREAGAAMLYCPPMVRAIVEGRSVDLGAIAEELFPDEYHGGVDGLRVEWVEQGARFLVQEYDGWESVTLLEDEPGLYTAPIIRVTRETFASIELTPEITEGTPTPSPDWSLRGWKVDPATLPTGPGPDLPDLTTTYEAWGPDDEGAAWESADLDEARAYGRQFITHTIIRVTREVIE